LTVKMKKRSFSIKSFIAQAYTPTEGVSQCKKVVTRIEVRI